MERHAGRMGRCARTVLLTAGIAAGVLWVSGGTGCAGKRRAMKQKEAELARAAASDEALDLATLAKQDSSVRAVLDAQDPKTWTDAPVPKSQRTSGSPSSARQIYSEEPLVLNEPGVAPASAADPGAAGTRSRGTRLSRSADAPPTAAPAGAEASPEAPGPGRELGTNETVVNAPVQIIPAATVSAIDAASLTPAALARTRAALAVEIARSVRAESPIGSPSYREGISLLALDTIEPGSVENDIGQYVQQLSPTERASFESVRRLMKSISGQDGSGAPASGEWEPGRVRQAIEGHLVSEAGSEPVAIRTAALCTSVDGFGRYTPYASTTFVRGWTTPAIVYVALDHVVQKPSAAGSDAGWSIDLVQTAKLYHDSDSLVVVDLGEQAVRDAARDQRRDLCIARRIDLPATLSLGKYNLKIAVRDQGSGATAEATIPIQIVADPSLTSK
ncbi:MAG: hypothetical protein AB7G11_05865 [Phycisphaerales bacterium]